VCYINFIDTNERILNRIYNLISSYKRR